MTRSTSASLTPRASICSRTILSRLAADGSAANHTSAAASIRCTTICITLPNVTPIAGARSTALRCAAPGPRVSATIKLVSPEVSSVSEVPTLSPPPDRIEQLYRELEDKIREYRPRDDLAPVEKAFRTAAELHKGQLRQSGEPYMVHPLMVAHILAGMRMDLVTIETGLLHDLVEDTRMTPDEIRKGFGDEVARCVDGVTKLSKLD